MHADPTDGLKVRTLRALRTTWGDLGPFVRVYSGEASTSPGEVKAVEYFKALFRQVRQEDQRK